MTPASPEQSLFAEAILLPTPEARAAYLDAVCGMDSALRKRVEALLRAAENAGDFLEEPPTGLSGENDSTTLVSALSEKPGDRIGRYKLLQQIGEGGCGVVYMAEQVEPVRRRVALKVIKLGMDTKSVIARFEAERQALALMDHPNIAKVLDAGATETGRPYFVMELVRGIKVTDYCDENNLSTTERLKLFTQVCQAIQHAHQKGIIHRDIKPSNILVTQNENEAVPKVIDFGIAKATTDQRLTDKTVFTAFEQFIGTPAYMSPEQAMMTSLDIDTRTDIYALGVLLYELLTGQTPFDANELMAAGLDAMRRTIREQEPDRPSTKLSQTLVAADVRPLQFPGSKPVTEDEVRAASRRLLRLKETIPLLRGDLDWIVMKALEKDRTRRYETANGLAMDIQRHLSNEPVMARPPSRWYEFQKTVRRHKFGFAAATALILVLGLGVLASSWQALRARRAERAQIKLREEADAGKKLAQTEAAKSQQVAQFMQDMLKGAGPSAAMGRDTAMLREILDRTAERIAVDLKDQPEVEAELRNSIGTVYWELGEYDKAATMQRQALVIQRRLFGNEHPSVAASLLNLALALRNQGKLAESEATFRESLALSRRLLGNEHPMVARALNDLGSLLTGALKDDEPETLIREALAIRRKVYGNEHGEVGISLDNLAHILNRRGQGAEATAMHQEALAIRRKFFGENHPELLYSYKNLAVVLQGQGKLAEAEAMLQEALALCERLVGQQHPSFVELRLHLADLLQSQGKLKEAELLRSDAGAPSRLMAASLHEAGRYQQWRGNLAAAEANYRDALAMKKKVFGEVHREIARTLSPLGQVLYQERKLAESELVYQEALAVERKLSGDEHPWVANLQHQLALLLYDSGKAKEAEMLFRQTVSLRRKLLGNEDADVADSMLGIGISLSRQARHAEAEPVVRDALLIGRKIPTAENWVANALLVLGYELRQQGELTESEAAYREAVAIRRKLFGSEHLELAHAIHGLVETLNEPGKWAEAEALRREELAMRQKLQGAGHPEVARAWYGLGELLVLQGRTAELESLLQSHIVEQTPATEYAQAQFGHCLWRLGDAYLQQDEFNNAERTYNRALQQFKQLQVQFPTNAFYRQEQAWSYRKISNVMQRTDRFPEAEASLRNASDIYLQLANEWPATIFYSQEAAITRLWIAELCGHQGKYAEARILLKEAGERTNASALNAVAWVLATSHHAELRAGTSALRFAEKAVADTKRKDPMFLDTLAAAYAEAGQFTNAVRAEQEAIALLPDAKWRVEMAARVKLYESNVPYRHEGWLAYSAGSMLAEKKYREAEPYTRDLLAQREILIPDDWRTFNARSMLGGSLLGQEKYAEAEPLLLSGYAGMNQRKDRIPVGNPNPKRALTRLVQLYEATGRPDKIAEWKQKLAAFEQAAAAEEPATSNP